MHSEPIRSGHVVRTPTMLATSLLAVGLVIGIQPAALAACHIAGFVEGEVEVAPDAGSVTLTVELQGRVESCEGTVDWRTQEGTATAGTDYTDGAGTLTFVAGDDRVEDITIEILDSGGTETRSFQVVLANTTGSIAGTGEPATVTISGSAAEPDATEPAATEPAPTDSEPGVDEAPVTDDAAADDGFPWVPVLLVVIVIGVVVGVLMTRRRPT